MLRPRTGALRGCRKNPRSLRADWTIAVQRWLRAFLSLRLSRLCGLFPPGKLGCGSAALCDPPLNAFLQSLLSVHAPAVASIQAAPESSGTSRRRVSGAPAKTTGKRTSLKTTSRDEAQQIVDANWQRWQTAAKD